MHWLKAGLYVIAQVSPRACSPVSVSLPRSQVWMLREAPSTCRGPLSDCCIAGADCFAEAQRRATSRSSWWLSLHYRRDALAQLVGGIAGALLEVALVPGLSWAWFGRHNKTHAPGCFYPGAVNNWELFLWELVLTFIFVRGLPASRIPCFQLHCPCVQMAPSPTVVWSSSSSSRAYTLTCGVKSATAAAVPIMQRIAAAAASSAAVCIT